MYGTSLSSHSTGSGVMTSMGEMSPAIRHTLHSEVWPVGRHSVRGERTGDGWQTCPRAVAPSVANAATAPCTSFSAAAKFRPSGGTQHQCLRAAAEHTPPQHWTHPLAFLRMALITSFTPRLICFRLAAFLASLSAWPRVGGWRGHMPLGAGLEGHSKAQPVGHACSSGQVPSTASNQTPRLQQEFSAPHTWSSC